MFPYSNTVADNASNVIAFDSSGTALTATQELGEFQGNWAASTAYVLRDIVKDTDNNNIYICVTAHTSSGSVPLSSNTDSAKWSLIVNAASATTSQTAAASSATAAASSATAAASSATGAASSATGAATSASSAEASTGAATFKYTFDNSTSIADPGSNGEWRWNNGTAGSVTSMAIRAATADTGNPDISPFIVTWDDSTSTVNGHVLFRKSGTPATFAIFAIGAITDNTAWLQVALTHVASNGTWSNADTGYISFIGRNGDKGDTGSTGAKGDAPGLLMAWETATGDSDQGVGKTWGNNGTVSSISVLYMDDVEAGGASINSFVDTWDDSTNSNPKGHIYIVKNSAPENFHLFAVTSTVVSASTYSKVPVSFIQTSGTISDGDACSVLFTRVGDKGADGSGSMTNFIMSDGSTTQTITDGQTQVFAAGEGLDVAVSSTDTVTYSGEDASTSNKGVASFHSDNFSVSSGAVTIKDGGVVEAEIADNAVTLAKMAGGTDGNIISFDASGNPVAIATGDDGEVLTSAGAGAPPAFEAAAGGGAWTEISHTNISSSPTYVEVTGLTATYECHVLVCTDIKPGTNNVNIAGLEVGDSGAYETGGVYYWRRETKNSAGSSYSAANGQSHSSFTIAESLGSATGEGFCAVIYIWGSDGVGYPRIQAEIIGAKNSSYIVGFAGGTFNGLVATVQTVTRMRFKFSSGTIAGGQYTLYGIKHS